MNLSRFSFSFRAIGLALLFVLASIPVYIGVRAVVTEVRTYQALKVEHAAIIRFLSEPVAKQKGEGGKEIDLNRAGVLSAIVNDVLAQAQKQAQQAQTPDPVK